jgi:hypothetical protein
MKQNTTIEDYTILPPTDKPWLRRRPFHNHCERILTVSKQLTQCKNPIAFQDQATGFYFCHKCTRELYRINEARGKIKSFEKAIEDKSQ